MQESRKFAPRCLWNFFLCLRHHQNVVVSDRMRTELMIVSSTFCSGLLDSVWRNGTEFCNCSSHHNVTLPGLHCILWEKKVSTVYFLGWDTATLVPSFPDLTIYWLCWVTIFWGMCFRSPGGWAPWEKIQNFETVCRTDLLFIGAWWQVFLFLGLLCWPSANVKQGPLRPALSRVTPITS